MNTDTKRLLTVEPSLTASRLMFNVDAGTKIFPKDPTDGNSVFRDVNRNMFFEWCEHHCKGRYWVGMGFVQLELEEDIMLFKLSWL